jgi:EAL domain-containing protein (putative c-di-GMP-specific phosphodiesterase class I)
VLAEACRQARAWQDAGLPPLRVSVNLSSRQFRSETLFESVTEALRASRLQPQLLELELTESLLVENVEHAMGVMGKLKAIVKAISALARSLGIGLIAEGVEEAWQAEFLRGRHCTEMQGFLFSRALPPEQMVEALSRAYSLPRASATVAALQA